MGLYTERTTDRVLKHEVVHWAMAKLGRSCKDGCTEFEKECKRVDAWNNYDLPDEKFVGELYAARCSKCNNIVVTPRYKSFISRHIQLKTKTTCCNEPIIYGGKVLIYESGKIDEVLE